MRLTFRLCVFETLIHPQLSSTSNMHFITTTVVAIALVASWAESSNVIMVYATRDVVNATAARELHLGLFWRSAVSSHHRLLPKEQQVLQTLATSTSVVSMKLSVVSMKRSVVQWNSELTLLGWTISHTKCVWRCSTWILHISPTSPYPVPKSLSLIVVSSSNIVISS